MDGWNLVRGWEDELFCEVIELTDSERKLKSFRRRDGTDYF